MDVEYHIVRPNPPSVWDPRNSGKVDEKMQGWDLREKRQEGIRGFQQKEVLLIMESTTYNESQSQLYNN